MSVVLLFHHCQFCLNFSIVVCAVPITVDFNSVIMSLGHMFLSLDNKIQGFVTDVSYVPYFSQQTGLNMARLKQFFNTYNVHLYVLNQIYLYVYIHFFPIFI